MPKEKANPQDVESLEYIRLVARVNEVMSACLGLPLDPEDGAAKYEKAAVKLATPDIWPADVVQRTQPFVTDFPWLGPLFRAKMPRTRCLVWEQVAEDLAASKTFADTVARRVWLLRALRPHFDRKTVYLEVIPEAQRIVIGKAAYLRDKAGKRADKNWLNEAIEYGRRAFYAYLWVIVTGGTRPPERDDTEGSAGPSPPTEPTQPPQRPQVKTLTDLQALDDDTLAEELFGEGREPSPEASAEDDHIRHEIGKLTEDEQEVLNRRFMDGESRRSISQSNDKGWTEYRVHQLEESALRKLRRSVGQ